MDKADLLDRAGGCLAGVAIGDAMGLPSQFLTPGTIEEEFGEIEEFLSPPDWHPYGDSPPGSITDDTEQTLAIAEMLISRGGDFSVEDSAQALLQWAKERGLIGTEHIGPSTGKALKAIQEGEDPRRTGFRGVTNGASMRISPLGIINPLLDNGARESLIEDVRRISTPTHNTPIGIAGATAVAGAIAASLGGASSPGEVIETARELGERAYREAEDSLPAPEEAGEETSMEILAAKISPSLGKRIELARELVEEVGRDELARELYDVVGTGVDTIETVPAALALFAAGQGDPMEAIRLAANAGGDTDTVASITGAISGAFAGMDGFPRRYVQKVEQVNELDISAVAEDLVSLIEL